MRLPVSVKDNLSFLLTETASQVDTLRVLLQTASLTLAAHVLDRHGYANNLKMRIHDGCIEELRRGKKKPADLMSLKAAETIASGMQQISRICRECVRLAQDSGGMKRLGKQRLTAMLDEIGQALQLLGTAIDSDDTQLALRLGNQQVKLDKAYRQLYRLQLKKLRSPSRPQLALSILFIAQRIREMGDVLKLVAEAIVSARLGQPMQLERYHALENAFSELGLQQGDFETIAETRSGSTIAGISAADDAGYAAIFKDGSKQKLREELHSVESWHEIFPGIAPQIYAFSKHGKQASLLIEHLPGKTLEQIVLQGDDRQLQQALVKLEKTLAAIWRETRRKKAAPAGFVRQLQKRLPGVLEIHPAFALPAVRVCGQKRSSLEQLLAVADRIEASLAVPFSVYIHGDFNIDNILYEADAGKIRFIDLHRSCYLDYVQDISVFMVSNYRLQVFDLATRRRIGMAASHLYAFAAGFAARHKDKTFNARLALGLARSFISSTRFILDRSLAKRLFFRGIYLLELLERTAPDEMQNLSIDIRELFA